MFGEDFVAAQRRNRFVRGSTMAKKKAWSEVAETISISNGSARIVRNREDDWQAVERRHQYSSEDDIDEEDNDSGDIDEELEMYNSRAKNVAAYGRGPHHTRSSRTGHEFTENDIYYFGSIQLSPSKARQIIMTNPPAPDFWNLNSIEKTAYLYYFCLYKKYFMPVKKFHNVFNREFFKYTAAGDRDVDALAKICKHTRDEFDLIRRQNIREVNDVQEEPAQMQQQLQVQQLSEDVQEEPDHVQQQLQIHQPSDIQEEPVQMQQQLQVQQLSEVTDIQEEPTHVQQQPQAQLSDIQEEPVQMQQQLQIQQLSEVKDVQEEPAQMHPQLQVQQPSNVREKPVQIQQQPQVQLSDVKEDPHVQQQLQIQQQAQKKPQQAKGGGITGYLKKQLVKMIPSGDEMKLPDDSKSNIYYDEKLGRWVGEGIEEPAAVPPPPLGMPAAMDAVVSMPTLPSAVPSSTASSQASTGGRRRPGANRYATVPFAAFTEASSMSSGISTSPLPPIFGFIPTATLDDNDEESPNPFSSSPAEPSAPSN